MKVLTVLLFTVLSHCVSDADVDLFALTWTVA